MLTRDFHADHKVHTSPLSSLANRMPAGAEQPAEFVEVYMALSYIPLRASVLELVRGK